MTDKLPSDFEPEDGVDDNGMEKCPVCEKQFSGEGGYHGEVYDSNGRKYSAFLNTDPGQGPFFCPDCWPQLEANKKRSENESLERFT